MAKLKSGTRIYGNVTVDTDLTIGGSVNQLRVTGVSTFTGISTFNNTVNVFSQSNTAGIFSGASQRDLVRITQTGTGNALVVEDAANPDASHFVVTGLGSLGVGITNPNSIVSIAHTFGEVSIFTPTVNITSQIGIGTTTYYNQFNYIDRINLSDSRIALEIDLSNNTNSYVRKDGGISAVGIASTFAARPITDWANNHIILRKDKGDYQPGLIYRGPNLDKNFDQLLTYNGYSDVKVSTSSIAVAAGVTANIDRILGHTRGYNPSKDSLTHGVINENTVVTGVAFGPYLAREFGAGGVGRIGFCYLTYGGDVVIRYSHRSGNYYPSAEEVGSAAIAPGQPRQVIMDSPIGTENNSSGVTQVRYLPHEIGGPMYRELGTTGSIVGLGSTATSIDGTALTGSNAGGLDGPFKDANRQTIGRVTKVVGNIDSRSNTSAFFCLTEKGYVWASCEQNTYGWYNIDATTDIEQPSVVWDIGDTDSRDDFVGGRNDSLQRIITTVSNATIGINTTIITGISTVGLASGYNVFKHVYNPGYYANVFAYGTNIARVGVTSITLSRRTTNTTQITGAGVSFGYYAGISTERIAVNLTSTYDMADDSTIATGNVYLKVAQNAGVNTSHDNYHELWTTGGYNASGSLGHGDLTNRYYARPCLFDVNDLISGQTAQGNNTAIGASVTQTDVVGMGTTGSYIQNDCGFSVAASVTVGVGTHLVLTFRGLDPNLYLGEKISLNFTGGTSVDDMYEVVDKIPIGATGIGTYDVKRVFRGTNTGKYARQPTTLSTSGTFVMTGRSRLLKANDRSIMGQWSGGGGAGVCFIQDSQYRVYHLGENTQGFTGDGRVNDRSLFTRISAGIGTASGGRLPQNQEIGKLVIAGNDGGFMDVFVWYLGSWQLWHAGANSSGYGYGNLTNTRRLWQQIAGIGCTFGTAPTGPIYNFWIRDRGSGSVASLDTLYALEYKGTNGINSNTVGLTTYALWAVGENGGYQLAQGTTTDSSTWTIPNRFPGYYGAAGTGSVGSVWFPEQIWTTSQTGSGGHGAIALFRNIQTNEYRLYAWGYNASGLLGLDAATSPTAPKRLNLGIPAYKIKDLKVYARDTNYDGIGLMITWDGEIYGIGGARYIIPAGGGPTPSPASYPFTSFWTAPEYGTTAGGRYFYSWTKINPLNAL